MSDNLNEERSSSPRLITHGMAVRILQVALALVLGLQGVTFAMSPVSRTVLAAAGMPTGLAVIVGGTEFIAALMLLRSALAVIAVPMLLLTFAAVIAIHIKLGQYTFLHLLYATAALLVVATYAREHRRV
jgi:hypothetical protein